MLICEYERLWRLFSALDIFKCKHLVEFVVDLVDYYEYVG